MCVVVFQNIVYIVQPHRKRGKREKGRKKANGHSFTSADNDRDLLEVGFQPLFFLFYSMLPYGIPTCILHEDHEAQGPGPGDTRKRRD